MGQVSCLQLPEAYPGLPQASKMECFNHCCKALRVIIWNKVFKNGASKICGRQLRKNLKWYGQPAYRITSDFLQAAFYKFYLVYSWILCPIYFVGVLDTRLFTLQNDCLNSKMWQLWLLIEKFHIDLGIIHLVRTQNFPKN